MSSPRRPKRRRIEVAADGPKQRNGNACNRCQRKKLKCQFSPTHLDRCATCAKSDAECVFDVSAAKIPGGAAYVAALEARIADLERKGGNNEAAIPVSGDSEEPIERSRAPPQGREDRATGHSPVPRLTLFSLLRDGPSYAERACRGLPPMPSPSSAKELLDTTFLYTQARYSIVDWIQIRKWHEARKTLLFPGDEPEQQTAAFFLWMIYAIGAQFVAKPEASSMDYFARAIRFSHIALDQKNIVGVQTLLVLAQFYFRVPNGPSPWQLSGLALQLCIELGYHRNSSRPQKDPLQTELQRRFFWGAYGYDRLFSMMSKRPFRIHDLDIDAELPVNVNVNCTDLDVIVRLQNEQKLGQESPPRITTMSSTLSQLKIYRLKSRIINRFGGPLSLPATTDEVMNSLGELDEWQRDALAKDTQYTPVVPRLGAERIQSAYLQGVLHLVRPMLKQTIPPPGLLQRCAKLSAAACDNAKQLCLHPETQNSLMTICNCFHYGLTLLQCLAVQPDVLPLHESLTAITACSTALGVYTKTLPSETPPFFPLFDKLSSYFFESTSNPISPLPHLQTSIRRLLDCGPSEIADVLEDLLKIEKQTHDVDGPANALWSSLVDPSVSFDLFDANSLVNVNSGDDLSLLLTEIPTEL